MSVYGVFGKLKKMRVSTLRSLSAPIGCRDTGKEPGELPGRLRRRSGGKE
jgi:hypothetical protein